MDSLPLDFYSSGQPGVWTVGDETNRKTAMWKLLVIHMFRSVDSKVNIHSGTWNSNSCNKREGNGGQVTITVKSNLLE
jgi:hypothetical protein